MLLILLSLMMVMLLLIVFHAVSVVLVLVGKNVRLFGVDILMFFTLPPPFVGSHNI
jgi:hypothetical protein